MRGCTPAIAHCSPATASMSTQVTSTTRTTSITSTASTESQAHKTCN